jgi:hypothetical protein
MEILIDSDKVEAAGLEDERELYFVIYWPGGSGAVIDEETEEEISGPVAGEYNITEIKFVYNDE